MEAVGPHVGLMWLKIKLQIVELVISSAISLIAIVTYQTWAWAQPHKSTQQTIHEMVGYQILEKGF